MYNVVASSAASASGNPPWSGRRPDVGGEPRGDVRVRPCPASLRWFRRPCSYEVERQRLDPSRGNESTFNRESGNVSGCASRPFRPSRLCTGRRSTRARRRPERAVSALGACGHRPLLPKPGRRQPHPATPRRPWTTSANDPASTMSPAADARPMSTDRGGRSSGAPAGYPTDISRPPTRGLSSTPKLNSHSENSEQ